MEMFTGEIPRIDEVKGLVGVKVFEQLRDNKPNLPKNLPAELEEFLNLCFSWKPEDRPTTEELLQHPFLTKDFEEEDVYDLASGSKSFYSGKPSYLTSSATKTSGSTGTYDLTDSIFDGEMLDEEDEDFFEDEHEEEEEEEQMENEEEEHETHEVEVHEKTIVDGQVLIPNQNRNSAAMKQNELDAEKNRENLLESKKFSDELLKAQETLRKEREKLEKEKKLVQMASENLQKKQTKMKQEEELRKKKKSKPKGLVGLFKKEIKKKIMSNSTLEADQSDFKLDQMKKVPSSNLPDE
jgi:serine/threonine protein kinase